MLSSTILNVLISLVALVIDLIFLLITPRQVGATAACINFFKGNFHVKCIPDNRCGDMEPGLGA
jgi:hypothetical protein